MMKMSKLRINTKTIKFKIILYTTLCLLTVGVLANIYIFKYLNQIILQKAKAIDEMQMENIKTQLDYNVQNVLDLSIICSSDLDIINTLSYASLDSLQIKKKAIAVQNTLNSYINSSNVTKYINKLIVFNEKGLLIQGSAQHSGIITDFTTITSSQIYKNKDSKTYSTFSNVYESITPFKGNCLALLTPVFDISTSRINGYVYMEISTDIITNPLTLYSEMNNIFVTTINGDKIIEPKNKELTTNIITSSINYNNTKQINYENVNYMLYSKQLSSPNLTIYNYVNLSNLYIDNRRIYWMLIAVVLSSLVASTIILMIVTHYITMPIKKLINRIQKISDNDFSYDPEIEKNKDEIGEIGKVVNEMSGSIQSLLNETVYMHDQKKNIEIALLQSQINPHFLYNTLDSIHWLAVLQKNTGICNITQGLTNLLKNMSKGFLDKISLEKELSLLNDYIAIQSIRYLDAFEVVNLIDKKYYNISILKLTLQPLVENAIFHGIEPMGKCGVITLNAFEDGDAFVITVHDNGVGMSKEKLESFMFNKVQTTTSSMNGIGINNVNSRLKLVYGNKYGITAESVLNEYTQISVRIPIKEASDV